MRPLCKDCAFISSGFMSNRPITELRCFSPNATQYRNLVSGESPACKYMRGTTCYLLLESGLDICGLEGNWFEPKEERK